MNKLSLFTQHNKTRYEHKKKDEREREREEKGLKKMDIENLIPASFEKKWKILQKVNARNVRVRYFGYNEKSIFIN